jgi:methionyl-tRNA formyltransferase
MGTPDFAVPTLAEILGAGHGVVAVYSQPPRPAGRGQLEAKTPIHAFAEASGLNVLTPKSLRNVDAQAAFVAHAADVAVVVAYGLILPKAILDAPRFGCLNLHGSKLPRWRGAAPIQRAIMAGDTETAAMVMRMDEGLDTGPICLAERIKISDAMTTGDLHDLMKIQGASLVVRALAALERGSLTATAQVSDGVTYAAKIDKAEAQIDFTQAASHVHNLVRGLSPAPGAWFDVVINGKSERLKILRTELVALEGPAGSLLDDQLTIACGSGAIRLLEVQRAGKRPMRADEFSRGVPLTVGTCFTGAAK